MNTPLLPLCNGGGDITKATTTTETNDIRDDLNNSLDALPLHEDGGVSRRNDPLGVPPHIEQLRPLAPSVLIRQGAQTSNTNEGATTGKEKDIRVKNGDNLFELHMDSSAEILSLREGYSWPNDDTNDIGLTLDAVLHG